MNTVRLIFSPTGGTRRAADALSADWISPNSSRRDCELSDPGTDLSSLPLSKSDLVLIALPSYGGRVPALAAERLAALRGNGAACVLLCTYGNRAYEDTLIELADLAERSGLSVLAAVTAVTEHSIARCYATGRPDEQDRQELRAFGQRIAETLSARPTTTPALPGNRPYKALSTRKLIPVPDESCNHCGLCAASCPVQAIDPETLHTDDASCIGCMRCVSVCPQQARHLDPATLALLTEALRPLCSDRKANELFI